MLGWAGFYTLCRHYFEHNSEAIESSIIPDNSEEKACNWEAGPYAYKVKRNLSISMRGNFENIILGCIGMNALIARKTFPMIAKPKWRSITLRHRTCFNITSIYESLEKCDSCDFYDVLNYRGKNLVFDGSVLIAHNSEIFLAPSIRIMVKNSSIIGKTLGVGLG